MLASANPGSDNQHQSEMAHASHREDRKFAEQLMQQNELVIEVVMARVEVAGHEAVGCKAEPHLSR